MLNVKYEIYVNDYMRKSLEKTFTDFKELEDWIFNQMQRDYTKDSYAMSFPTPKTAERIHAEGPWRIEFQPKQGEKTYWIQQIEDSRGILFSDGTFTSGQKHWNNEVKEWLIHCDARQHAPQFNFAEDIESKPTEIKVSSKDFIKNGQSLFFVLDRAKSDFSEKEDLLLIRMSDHAAVVASGWNEKTGSWDCGNYYGSGTEELNRAISFFNGIHEPEREPEEEADDDFEIE